MTYYVTDTTPLSIPACTVNPSICPNTSQGSLTSIGTATPALGFAVLTKNIDNSFTITLTSSDALITGLTYTLSLGFTDTSVILASVTQPTTPAFNILVKCTRSVDCSLSVQSDVDYYITDTTPLTIPACTLIPNICPNTSSGTLTSTGATVPDASFSAFTKNTDNSFTITLASTDVLINGLTYSFSLGFTESSVTLADVTQPVTPTFNVVVKCTKSVDCSASIQSNLIYYLMYTTQLIAPACIMVPNICPNTTSLTLASTGTDTSDPLFAVIAKNLDNSFTITLSSTNLAIVGLTY